MNIHWALYDPSHLSSENSYWTWRAPILTTPLLEKFYYGIAAKNLPPAPNELTETTFWGGLAAPIDKWVVAYRFFDGGRDRQGRPGRFVLLVAWMDAGDIDRSGHVFKDVFSHQTFCDVESMAKTSIPIPSPVELSSRVTPSSPKDVQGSPNCADSKSFNDACRQFAESLLQGGMHMLLRGNEYVCQSARVNNNSKAGNSDSAGKPQTIETHLPSPKKMWLLLGVLVIATALVLLGVSVFSRLQKESILDAIQTMKSEAKDQGPREKLESESPLPPRQPTEINPEKETNQNTGVISPPKPMSVDEATKLIEAMGIGKPKE